MWEILADDLQCASWVRVWTLHFLVNMTRLWSKWIVVTIKCIDWKWPILCGMHSYHCLNCTTVINTSRKWKPIFIDVQCSGFSHSFYRFSLVCFSVSFTWDRTIATDDKKKLEIKIYIWICVWLWENIYKQQHKSWLCTVIVLMR